MAKMTGENQSVILSSCQGDNKIIEMCREMDMDLIVAETTRKMQIRVDKCFPANLQKLCSLQLICSVLIIKLSSRYILLPLYNEMP